MTADIRFVSRYDFRLKLVQDILKEETKLTDKASHALAVRVVRALDTIPERVR